MQLFDSHHLFRRKKVLVNNFFYIFPLFPPLNYWSPCCRKVWALSFPAQSSSFWNFNINPLGHLKIMGPSLSVCLSFCSYSRILSPKPSGTCWRSWIRDQCSERERERSRRVSSGHFKTGLSERLSHPRVAVACVPILVHIPLHYRIWMINICPTPSSTSQCIDFLSSWDGINWICLFWSGWWEKLTCHH